LDGFAARGVPAAELVSMARNAQPSSSAGHAPDVRPGQNHQMRVCRTALAPFLLAFLPSCGSDADGAESPPAKPDLPTVVTAQGAVVGVLDSDRHVWSFNGIPFAAAPVGELRWRSPQPPLVRAQPFDASQYGPACLQVPESGQAAIVLGATVASDEDCLTLNVWLPETLPADPLPVMVWFHGGGFVLGAGSQQLYDGALLAQRGVAVVTVNYRLGPLGFMAHEALIGEEGRPSAGNYGLLDQIAALKWVRDNIAHFGGDPGQVTIFGESAGGVSACTLLASPLSGGLFHAAIDQSGPCLNDIAIHDLSVATAGGPPAIEQGARIAAALGCEGDPDVLGCLRSKPGADVMAALPNTIFMSATGAEGWRPIVDHYVLESSVASVMGSAGQKKMPLLLGFTADEGTLLSLSLGTTPTAETNQALVASLIGEQRAAEILAHYSLDRFGGDAAAQLAVLIGDGVMVCPGRRAARDHVAAGNRVFAYEFTHVTSFGQALNWGAFHGSDIPFVFGNVPPGITATADELTLMGRIQELWTSFAKTGAPAATDAPVWQPYDAQSEARLDLDVTISAENGWQNAADCDVWERVLGTDL
jgi:para-nitrobenzyl esterase